MRFIFAKHDLVCKHCGGEIPYGELFCRTFHRNKQTGATFGFCYHYQCYIEDYTEKIRKSALYWMGQQVAPMRRGRPVKSTNPREYRRLKALRRYHVEAGNVEAVRTIDDKLREIEPNADL